jgi:hypothetical protein
VWVKKERGETFRDESQCNMARDEMNIGNNKPDTNKQVQSHHGIWIYGYMDPYPYPYPFA